MSDVLFLVLGLILLTVGGELLIRGALGVAHRFGISPLLSGLVIVGFGTSAPELVVSMDAALSQRPDIALGNVIGSNIGNIFLILGVCAVTAPLTVKPSALRRDGFMVLVTSLLFIGLAWDLVLSRVEAAILLLILVCYLISAYRSERKGQTPESKLHIDESKELTRLPRKSLLVVFAVTSGLGFLIGGAQLFLSGAVGIAQSLDVSQALIGLTIVAVGTSLPELTISIIATIRRHADVAVGNILGSNIFNLLGILSLSAVLQPIPIHQRIVIFDQWVLVLSSIILVIFLYSGSRLSRIEGALLIVAYSLYVGISFTYFAA